MTDKPVGVTVTEFGYVIRWRAACGGEWRYAAPDFDKSLSSASIYTLRQASQQLKQYEKAPTAEIVRVRRVAGETQWENVPLQGLYWGFNGGAMHRPIDIPYSSAPNEVITLDRSVSGDPRWEVIEGHD